MTQPAEELNDLFYTSGQTARFFGVSPTTLLRWTESGRIVEEYNIRYLRGENSHHYYLKSDVKRVWQELQEAADDEASRNRQSRGNLVHQTESSS